MSSKILWKFKDSINMLFDSDFEGDQYEILAIMTELLICALQQYEDLSRRALR